GVEDQVVGPLERHPIVLPIERLHLTRHRHALDLPADVVVRLLAWQDHLPAAKLNRVPRKSTVLGNVDGTVGSERRAVGPASRFRDDRLLTVSRDPCHRSRTDLNERDVAARQLERAFGKGEVFSNNAKRDHGYRPLMGDEGPDPVPGRWIVTEPAMRSRGAES